MQPAINDQMVADLTDLANEAVKNNDLNLDPHFLEIVKAQINPEAMEELLKVSYYHIKILERVLNYYYYYLSIYLLCRNMGMCFSLSSKRTLSQLSQVNFHFFKFYLLFLKIFLFQRNVASCSWLLSLPSSPTPWPPPPPPPRLQADKKLLVRNSNLFTLISQTTLPSKCLAYDKSMKGKKNVKEKYTTY